MPLNFLNNNKKIHFIGIGGISMSGLAAILLNKNYKVSGSDSRESNIINELMEKGAEIYIGHNKNNIKNVDLVVYTAAIPKDNPEIIKANELNIPLMDRAEFLGSLMKHFKYNIAVAGTHGKTTVTSMLSQITLEDKLDPTILVGGELSAISGNYRIGNSEYFLTEACEYKESFLKFYPYVGTILNIDADHLDYYKDINHIQRTFEKFSKLIPKDGFLVGCADDIRVKEILDNATCNIMSYGLNSGIITAKNITFDSNGCSCFDVYKKDSKLFNVNLNVPGNHNILNALSAICVSLVFNIPKESIINGLNAFKNADKRFQLKGVKNEITVIDDYAHHPVEIQATLNTAKKIKHNKIICVFQPHTYTRTKSLFNEFTDCFSDADNLILMDIYAAREKDTGLVSSNELGNALRNKGIKCTNVHSHKEALEYVKHIVEKNDLLLTIGAGDVVKVGEMFLNEK